jgi:asparagine synthase (glutamine-hydrolysing)
MTVQFGIWNLDGHQIPPDFLRRAGSLCCPYGTDRESQFSSDNMKAYFRPTHETQESRSAEQPVVGAKGTVLTWDGRLDNRDELCAELDLKADAQRPDARIVAAAYERWGVNSLAKLLGDWALAIWDPKEHSLVLARDFLGARQLYYIEDRGTVMWSTVLDPLVLLSPGALTICESYIADYLLVQPEAHITPFGGVKAVPPACFILIKKGCSFIHTYWRFDPKTRTRYLRDDQYEDHFRQLLEQALRRRLRSCFPVLAELSGGIDSSSLVCVADRIIARGEAATPRLDTISYYDDHEPSWNERPYFSIIEQKRGREGYHLDFGSTYGAFESSSTKLFHALPGHDERMRRKIDAIVSCAQKSQSRVLLSGIGGDEFLGGVPNPSPELQDLLVQLEWTTLMRQVFRWSLEKRRPWIRTAHDFLIELLPMCACPWFARSPIPPWFTPKLRAIHRATYRASFRHTSPPCGLPSFQASLDALDHVKRQLSSAQRAYGVFSATFPYLDRDLLSFLFSIPREQLLRPGQRRSLMRRALSDTVPREVLSGRRKAYVARHPLILLQTSSAQIKPLFDSPLVVKNGWVDLPRFLDELESAKNGRTRHQSALHRTLHLELWLRSIAGRTDGWSRDADVFRSEPRDQSVHSIMSVREGAEKKDSAGDG